MSRVRSEYVSVGGNRQSSAADNDCSSGQIVFGADDNVAIWTPGSDTGSGVCGLLKGRGGFVTAVKHVKLTAGALIVSGSANGSITVWHRKDAQLSSPWIHCMTWKGHEGSVNAITNLETKYLATAGADSHVNIWRISDGEDRKYRFDLNSTLKLLPRYIPLAIAAAAFEPSKEPKDFVLVVGGTTNAIQVYSLTSLGSEPQHVLAAKLSGHEGWIRSLALWSGDDVSHPTQTRGVLLASASHDKYIRLWRFQPGKALVLEKSKNQQFDVSSFEQTLASKVQNVFNTTHSYSITFEALLLGHEDWIYSVAWNPSENQRTPHLLSASADGTMAVWEPDPESGFWVTISRLGEISAQKGATTATGSAGGFWTGLWLPREGGAAVAALDRTGSWRYWESGSDLRYWTQRHGLSGHIGPVNGLAWSTDGSYLLSTSSDQTTRLHAEWMADDSRSWHEISRPQIHGYDLNCVTSVGPEIFVSGADEKLLRVFEKPKAVAQMLTRLCKIEIAHLESLPDVAVIPVLGLSNKAAVDGVPDAINDEAQAPAPSEAFNDIREPPTEDLLARHTLWPEHEKLYGHGYEISEAAANAEVGILATACKASSIDHAVIRLYDTATWHEIKPPLASHTLTVTRLAFSRPPDTYLLSVGRDRQWTVFKQSRDTKQWEICQSNPKAHTRMILDCACSPSVRHFFFVTASRDKTVKIWSSSVQPPSGPEHFELRQTLKRDAAVTAVSLTCNEEETRGILAIGEENGQLSVHLLDLRTLEITPSRSMDIEQDLCPSKAINRLAWRPHRTYEAYDGTVELAVASADASVRIFTVHVDSFQSDRQ